MQYAIQLRDTNASSESFDARSLSFIARATSFLSVKALLVEIRTKQAQVDHAATNRMSSLGVVPWKP